MAARSLVTHQNMQIDVRCGPHWKPPPSPKIDPKTYCMYLPKDSSSLVFLVVACQRRAARWTNLHVTFVRKPMQYMVVIMEEGNHINTR